MKADMPARLPDFLGIGTQKGGTTSLHRWLSNHPQVFLPACKEVHYFDLQYNKEIKWYSSQFNEATDNQKVGEITPHYLFHPKAATRISRDLPEVKLIILLRDPAERAISQMFHARQRGFERLQPNEAFEAEELRMSTGDPITMQRHSYVSRSRYLEQLERYEKHFKRQNMLIMKSEEIFEKPDQYWRIILDFLQIQSMPLRNKFVAANKGEGNKSEISIDLKNKIRTKLASTEAGIRDRYGFGWNWD